MEAALCATPSVALAIGGLSESIVEGQTGFLAADTAELAARVCEIVGSPQLRDRMGEAARERARTFSWDHSARSYLDVLHRAAGRDVPDALAASNGSGHKGSPAVTATRPPR